MGRGGEGGGGRKKWNERRGSSKRILGAEEEAQESSKLENGGLFHPRNLKSRRRAAPLVAPYAALTRKGFPSFFLSPPFAIIKFQSVSRCGA